MTDVAEIARRMSDAAKHIAKTHPMDMTTTEALELPMCGVVERCPIRPSRWRLTELGFAVRAHLTQEQPR